MQTISATRIHWEERLSGVFLLRLWFGFGKVLVLLGYRGASPLRRSLYAACLPPPTPKGPLTFGLVPQCQARLNSSFFEWGVRICVLEPIARLCRFSGQDCRFRCPRSTFSDGSTAPGCLARPPPWMWRHNDSTCLCFCGSHCCNV